MTRLQPHLIFLLLLSRHAFAGETEESRKNPREQPQTVPASPAPPPAASQVTAPPTAGYKNGFFIATSDGSSKLRLRGMVQPLFDYQKNEVAGSEDSEEFYRFSVVRARLALLGHALSPRLTFRVLTEYGQGRVSLKDFFFDYAFLPQLHLRIGQDRLPTTRQLQTPIIMQQFVNRAITNRYFAAGRDIGFLLHNDITQTEGVEYALGLYNGTGDGAKVTGTGTADAMGDVAINGVRASNVPVKFYPMSVLRLGYNNGINGYSEPDLEGGKFRWGIGASALVDFNANQLDDGRMNATLDGIIKYRGFAASGALFISNAQNGEDWLNDRDIVATGAQAQLGYLILQRIEPAIRWAGVNPSGASNTINTYTGGLNAYFFKNQLKWQNDFTVKTTENGPDERLQALQFRSQAQFLF